LKTGEGKIYKKFFLEKAVWGGGGYGLNSYGSGWNHSGLLV